MHSKHWSRLLLFALLFCASAALFAQVNVVVSFGPPALPVYDQPLCPGEGYVWTPGYWAYDPDFGDYFWVPGTWILAPVGYLWTPPWWGWNGGGGYAFHPGYWGPQVGFYGGIVYGNGYFGRGYEGGRWDGNHFYYNRSVNNVNVNNVRYVYNTRVVNNYNTVNRVSYNGGNGGVRATPTPQEQAAERERHIAPVAAQTEHIQSARNDQQLRASTNHGRPPVAATAKPGALRGPEAVPAKEAGAPYHPPENRGMNATGAGRATNNVPRPPTHAKDVSPHVQPGPPNTGNAKQDQRYEQQQQKLHQQQDQQHQRMVQQQGQDHQRAQQQHSSAVQEQQMEQRHAQQTQQMEQKHVQQQQHLDQRQPQAHYEQGAPPSAGAPHGHPEKH